MQTSEAQVCFVIDGFMFCNYVVRKGVEIRSKTGKYLKFPIRWKQRTKKNEERDEVKGKTATSQAEKVAVLQHSK